MEDEVLVHRTIALWINQWLEIIPETIEGAFNAMVEGPKRLKDEEARRKDGGSDYMEGDHVGPEADNL